MKNCPKCGSSNIYNHDKGWIYIWRHLFYNSRLVCKNCNTTWKKGHPEKFSKLKRKSKSRPISYNVTSKLKDGADALKVTFSDQITLLVGKWQEEGDSFICLDFEKVKILSTRDLGNIMELYRRIRSIGGDMIIAKASVEVNDYFWSLNLGYLIAANHKIVS